MKITQHDIAGLSDDDVRRLVISLRDLAGGQPPSARRYTDRHAVALVRALNDRRRLLAIAELEVLNDEEEGAVVEPGAEAEPKRDQR